MDIGIIGGGAIGLLFASYLHKVHHVTVYTRTAEQAQCLNEKGLLLKKGNETEKAAIQAFQLEPAGPARHDLLIVAVKQYHLEGILPFLAGGKSPLLFLQNGMGHLEYIHQLPQEKEIYVGVVEHGAMKQGDNIVCHTGIGAAKVASVTGDMNLIAEFTQPGFPFVCMDDYEEMLKSKLIANAVINPLTAVLSAENGELLANPFYHELFLRLFDEVALVLEFPDKQKIREHVADICRRTAENRSSMLRDLENGRKTEIDAILKYTISLAEKKSLDVPLSRSLYAMVKGKEVAGKEA